MEENEKMKTFHFFNYGEHIETIHARTKESAIKGFNTLREDEEFDFILEYTRNSYIPVHL